MVDVTVMNKGELRAAMRAADLPYEGLNVEGMRAALVAHAEQLAARIVTEEVPVPFEGPFDPVDGLPGLVAPVDTTEPVATAHTDLAAELGIVEQVAPGVTVVEVVVPPPVARPARAESYGVKQPAVGTICRQIWDYCDAVYNAGEMPKAKALRAWGAGRLDDTTMTVQFYRWRKFMGIGGRQA